MSSQGPNNPSAAVNTDSGGAAFSNPTYVFSSNDQYAFLSDLPAYSSSDYLDITNFGFTVTDGSSINGIKVEIERSCNGGSSVRDALVQLIVGGTPQGNNKKSSVSYPTSDAYATYGGAVDKWGLSLSASDIRATNFGVRVQVENYVQWSRQVGIDHVRLTVYYTKAPNYTLVAQSSSIGFSPKNSNLIVGRLLKTSSTSILFLAKTALMKVSRKLTAGFGVISLSAKTALFNRAYTLKTIVSYITLIGNTAQLKYSNICTNSIKDLATTDSLSKNDSNNLNIPKNTSNSINSPKNLSSVSNVLKNGSVYSNFTKS